MLSEEKKEILEAAFAADRYPPQRVQARLCEQVGATPKQIQCWYAMSD